jgi:peptidoglycan/LPS O-acetylase OafA/YrhL
MRYRPEIDGLRAIAVIPVIFFHARWNVFRGGYVGVDVFFVISGYLITSIIAEDLKQKKFSLLDFYERRARRILPALFFIVAICVPVAYLLLLPGDLMRFASSVVAVTTFSSNFLFWSESGYFAPVAELKPLLHTWSLAVEEQFYILFPLILVLAWRFGRRWIIATFAILLVVSLGAAQWGVYASPAAAFYLLPTRGWELALGALIAIYLTDREEVAGSEWLSLTGLGLVLFSVFAFGDKTPSPSLFTLVPTCGVALIILYTSPNTAVFRLLSHKSLVGLGLMSYSAYLWHQPLLAFARNSIVFYSHKLSITITLVVLTFVLSFFSWRFIERYFRNRSRLGRRHIFSFSGTAAVVLLVCGVISVLANGFPERYQISLGAYTVDNHELSEKSVSILRTISEPYGQDEYEQHHLWFNLADPRPKVLLVGNSHSNDLFNVFWFSESVASAFQIARYGCQVKELKDAAHPFFSSPNYRAADIVILASAFLDPDIPVLPTVLDKLSNDKKSVAVVQNIIAFPVFGNFTLADKHIFAFMREYPDFRNRMPQLEMEINKLYFEAYREGKNVNQEINQRIKSITKERNIPVLDRMDYVCDRAKELCYGVNSEIAKLFFDYGHHTLAGARFFGKRVDQVGWLSALSSMRLLGADNNSAHTLH